MLITGAAVPQDSAAFARLTHPGGARLCRQPGHSPLVRTASPVTEIVGGLAPPSLVGD